MSVSTGGTGLNVTEANHILFLDRWFNPCVHDQAMVPCLCLPPMSCLEPELVKR
jgi:hypothetical protein